MFGYRVPAPDQAMLISGGRAEGNANVVVEVGRFLVPCGNRGLLLRARQLLTEATRRVFDQETSTTLDVLYDVSHNLAKLEKHPVDGQTRTVCVHRKGGDPLPAAAPSRPTRRPGHGRPAGADTGHDGHRLLRTGRRAR